MILKLTFEFFKGIYTFIEGTFKIYAVIVIFNAYCYQSL